MRNLHVSRQTNEPNLDDFHAGTLSHAVSGRRGSFTCDVKPTTMEQHLLIKTRRATEYRQIKQQDNQALRKAKYCTRVAAASCTQKKKTEKT